MRLLSLDIGLKCGWCKGSEWGLEVFKNGVSKPREFYEFLCGFDIDWIFYEEPVGGHFVGTRSHSHFEAMIMYYCEVHDKGLYGVKPSELKKYATGNGRASKGLMVESLSRYGIEGVRDDNIADAIHLWHYGIERFK